LLLFYTFELEAFYGFVPICFPFLFFPESIFSHFPNLLFFFYISVKHFHYIAIFASFSFL